MKTKKNPDNVGVGVIGLGRGKGHVESAFNAENGELLAVCDINKQLVNEIAQEYDVDAYVDFREMIKRDDIDLVSVCTPSGLHCDMAIEIAKAGKHVISEKPLDVKLDKIDRAINVFKERNLKFGCIFQSRFKDSNQKVKEAVDAGKLGKLTLANARVKWYRTQSYYEKNGGWRGTWDLDGGGSLINQSVHTIDLMQWIMGPVSSVIGVTNVWSHNIETEDMGVALVKFRNGAFGTIVGSTSTYPGFGTDLDIHGVNGGIQTEYNRIVTWKIKGDNMEEKEKEIVGQYGPDSKRVNPVSDPDAIENNPTFLQIQDMINAVKEDREPAVNAKEGRKAVEIILAIYESARTGKEVFLPL